MAFMFIYILVGMQLFHHVKISSDLKLDSDTIMVSRILFDNVYNSFISVFIILTLENWNQIQ